MSTLPSGTTVAEATRESQGEMMMARTRGAALGLVVLLGVTTTGCGAGEDATRAPTDASVEDFCLTFVKFSTSVGAKFRSSLSGADGALPEVQDLVDFTHDWAYEMSAVGTPADISEEARAGFEAVIEESAELDADDVDLDNLDSVDPSGVPDDMSTDELNERNAFNDYTAETCGDLYRDRGLL